MNNNYILKKAAQTGFGHKNYFDGKPVFKDNGIPQKIQQAPIHRQDLAKAQNQPNNFQNFQQNTFMETQGKHINEMKNFKLKKPFFSQIAFERPPQNPNDLFASQLIPPQYLHNNYKPNFQQAGQMPFGLKNLQQQQPYQIQVNQPRIQNTLQNKFLQNQKEWFQPQIDRGKQFLEKIQIFANKKHEQINANSLQQIPSTNQIIINSSDEQNIYPKIQNKDLDMQIDSRVQTGGADDQKGFWLWLPKQIFQNQNSQQSQIQDVRSISTQTEQQQSPDSNIKLQSLLTILQQNTILTKSQQQIQNPMQRVNDHIEQIDSRSSVIKEHKVEIGSKRRADEMSLDLQSEPSKRMKMENDLSEDSFSESDQINQKQYVQAGQVLTPEFLFENKINNDWMVYIQQGKDFQKGLLQLDQPNKPKFFSKEQAPRTQSFFVYYIKKTLTRKALKIFECRYSISKNIECCKTFGSMSKLYAHLRIHTNERPFKCLFCQMQFTQKGNLNQHTRMIHFKQNFNEQEDLLLFSKNPAENKVSFQIDEN